MKSAIHGASLFFLGCVFGRPLAGETLNVTGKISAVSARDLNGDGAREILVAHARGAFPASPPPGDGGARTLSIFFSKSGRYGGQPDRSIAVKPDAVAVAVGDYAPGNDLDLVLLGRQGFYLYPFRDADPDAGIQKLFSCQLFFVAPHGAEIPLWPGDGPGFPEKLDLDGDGLDDFLVPEREELRLVYQERRGGRAVFERQEVLPVPYFRTEDSQSERATRRIEEFVEGKGGGSFLAAKGSYPYPMVADFDGDRKPDLLILRPGAAIEVYQRKAAGGFDPEPRWRLEVPWIREAIGFAAADLNGDGRIDFIANRPLQYTSSEVLVFIQNPQDLPRSLARPAQVLRVSGLFARPELADADGDGRLDLLIASWRLDLLEQVKKTVVEEIEITHLIYPGAAATPFERQPALKERFTLFTRSLSAGSYHPYLLAGRDLTGDGIPDLVQVDAERRLRLFKGRGGGRLGYEELRIFSEPIGEPEEISIRELDGKAGEEILIRYEQKMLIRRASE
ncbi:MAG: VCBS repeat-containing protein [Planctomycetes bacterium]|nr:VCBS repeat-containing protein [Planctomycetota bacterium]